MADNQVQQLGNSDALMGQDHAIRDQADVIGFISTGEHTKVAQDGQLEAERIIASLVPRDEARHDINAYLARWVRVATATYSANSTTGTRLMNINILDVLRTDTAFTMMREKLRGFLGFTGTLEVKLTCNAQPFQAGLLALCFAPFVKDHEAGIYSPLDLNTEFGLPFVSGLPNVLMNIACDTQVVLSVPYIGPNGLVFLTDSSADWGNIMVYEYTPVLAADNGSSVEIVLYARFVDVKLFGVTELTFQGDDIVEKVSNPPASTVIANAVPIVDKVAPASTNLVNNALRLAESLGFCKPNADPNIDRMAITPFGQMANANGHSNAFKFSVDSSQNTCVTAFGLTREDEMNISYIARRPGYVNQFKWDTTKSTGDRIGWLHVSPNVYLARDSTQIAPNHLYAVSSLFRYWRGGIRFNFHVVGTKFHSGRLRFYYSFLPSITGTLAPNPDYCYSQVVDIRDSSTFHIDCPWLALTPWKVVPTKWNNDLGCLQDTISMRSRLNATEAFLSIYVENVLVVPNTASSNVQLVVFSQALEDFELAAPSTSGPQIYTNYSAKDDPLNVAPPPTSITTSTTATTTTTTTQSPATTLTTMSKRRLPLPTRTPTGERFNSFEAVTPQGKIDDETAPCISMVSQSSVRRFEQQYATQCMMGEKVVSLRTLAKRYSFLGNTSQETNSQYVVLPFCFRATWEAGTSKYFTDEWVNNIMAFYRFWRGGMRLLIVPESNTGNVLTNARVHYSVDPSMLSHFSGKVGQYFAYYVPMFAQDFNRNNPFCASVEFINQIQGGVEIQCPYYSAFPFLLTDVAERATTAIPEYQHHIYNAERPTGFALLDLNSGTHSTESHNFHVYRAAADDFQCSYLIGAPLMRCNFDFYGNDNPVIHEK